MLNIHNTQPRLIRLTGDGQHAGWDHDRAAVKKYLLPRCLYFMTEMVVGGFQTAIQLHGLPGVWFNAVQFEEVETEAKLSP